MFLRALILTLIAIVSMQGTSRAQDIDIDIDEDELEATIESAVEQAKDEQISDFIRDKYKETTGKEFFVADKDKKFGS